MTETMTVTLVSDRQTLQVSVSEVSTVLELLREYGYEISAPCGGQGKCGKCLVGVMENGGEKQLLPACKTLVRDGMTVEIPTVFGTGLTTDSAHLEQTDGETGCGLAVDIGTTTVALYFADLQTGKTLKTASFLNPQRSFGADVISRVEYATAHGIDAMFDCLRAKINEQIDLFRQSHGLEIAKMMVTGNTVMLHIFAGEEISTFGYFPFTPAFLEDRAWDGSELGYHASRVVCLPSFSSFVGADIVCGGIAVDITDGNNLLIDLGTNGEMLLCYNGKLYSTSVAAGPAFEGADIACGMGGVNGAVCRVWSEDGRLMLETVGGCSPIGICGSGLVDAVAYLLSVGVIDETGAFADGADRFDLTDGVYVSADDVRKFQLAKSAVRAGIEVLLRTAGCLPEEISHLYVCGGMGYYMDRDNAIRVGLIPAALHDRVCIAGNTAGLGAKMCLLRQECFLRARTLARSAEQVDLSSNPTFSELFMEHMFFE